MIFLHIGLQKTGTTSLQYILNKKNLLRFPIDPIMKIKEKSNFFYTSGNQKFFYRCRRNSFKETDFKSSSNKNVIITCENFSNPDDNLKSLNNLLNYLTNKKKKFIIVLTYRNFEDYCKSMYAEAITNSFVCEMRLYENYKKSLDIHINKLNKLIMDYPVKRFKYDNQINSKIFKFITGNELIDSKIFINNKRQNCNFEIKELEKIAVRNRLNGWIPKYRFALRRKYKNVDFDSSFIYIILTYLRSLLRLII